MCCWGVRFRDAFFMFINSLPWGYGWVFKFIGTLKRPYFQATLFSCCSHRRFTFLSLVLSYWWPGYFVRTHWSCSWIPSPIFGLFAFNCLSSSCGPVHFHGGLRAVLFRISEWLGWVFRYLVKVVWFFLRRRYQFS